MSDTDLKPILRDLIHAEAHRAACDIAAVFVNTEDKAGDEGADALTPRPNRPSSWLGTTPTCWQFKAGSAGAPAKLKSEVKKAAPAGTLRAGHRFVVIASGSASGVTGRDKRLGVLKQAAKRLKLPVDRIEVFTSESLASWLDEHPAVAARLAGFPEGWQTLPNWLEHPHHSLPWHGTPNLDSKIETLRSDIDPVGGSQVHVHVYGFSGVGKSRFVLEACRDARWNRDVLYVDDGQRTSVSILLERLVATPNATSVIVVDEATSKDALRWNGIVARGSGRLRLITIGQDRTPDRGRIPEVRIDPLELEEMDKVLGAWASAVPSEHRRFIARFSGGYVRLAHLALTALQRDSTLDVHGLLESPDVRQVLDSMIGDPSRRESLYVAAALETVGWEGAAEAEGRAIAAHLGLEWSRVRLDVEYLDRRFGIVPRAGDRRYVSPRPLGALVATDAWRTYPDRMRLLLDHLPSEVARQQYEKRISAIVTTPRVREFAREELARFFLVEHFASEPQVRFWRSLCAASPAVAARLVSKALATASVEDRLRIDGGARRQLVWGLVDLAWKRDGFRGATLSLAYLAVAENENYGNNATDEFLRKFQIWLGGTAAPYSERFALLEELQTLEPSYRVLAVRALGIPLRIANGEMRIGRPSVDAEAPESEWTPSLHSDYVAIVLEALQRLTAIAASDASADVGFALLKVTDDAAMLLRQELAREPVARLMREVANRDPSAREELWRSVHRVVDGEEKYWKQLSADELGQIRAVLNELEDPSLDGRTRRAVSVNDWEATAERFESLAAELVRTGAAQSTTLWQWLMSGAAGGAWHFGQALARADSDGAYIQGVNPVLAGPDLRVIAGYLTERRAIASADWVDDWIDNFVAQYPDQGDAAAELTWRCSATVRGARRFVGLVRKGHLARESSEHLSYGGWGRTIPDAELVEVVDALAQQPVHRGSAVALIELRVKSDPAFLQLVEGTTCALVSDPDVVRSSPNHGFYWEKLARALLDTCASEIIRGIIQAEVSAERGWSIRWSPANGILSTCADRYPVAVWEQIAPHLEEEDKGRLWLPEGIVDRLPHKLVLDWVAQRPKPRGRMIARMVLKNFVADSLFIKLLERFGNIEAIAGALRSHFLSGQWFGEASNHWTAVGESLKPLIEGSYGARVVAWARELKSDLQEMTDRERAREAEERALEQ